MRAMNRAPVRSETIQELRSTEFAVPAVSASKRPARSCALLLCTLIVSLGAATPSALAAPAQAQSAQAPTTTLAAVLADPRRSEKNRLRDSARHPLQTLQFFGVEANATLVEIYPGGGWYTEILAPYLKSSGRYYAALPYVAPGATGYMADSTRAYRERLASDPAAFDAVVVTAVAPPAHVDIAPAGTADFVLTFRNVHNWMSAGNAAGMFDAFFAALKPGGVLGVVEHRATPGSSIETMIKSGYVTEQQVIDYAVAAGFTLEARSEINANAKDTKDYPQGVWTLPPVLRLKDVDREKYLAIGESDRMTLRFRKPASTPAGL